MTPNPIHVTRRDARHYQRNLQEQGKQKKPKEKRMVGREIMPGVVVHVAEDVSEKTIEALKELALCVLKMADEDLKEVEVFADYLKSKHKSKAGRPRKAK